uniref:Uncharacterized protein n=1 Tax=Avena sativa TaxID=4498 RepID=A0ACD5UDV3_AVESA
MAMRSKSEACCILWMLVALCCFAAARTASAEGRIDDHLQLNGGFGSVSEDGQILSLLLNHSSGSGFKSKDTYMYARANLQIKLAPNNSAGTVTAFYFMSVGAWDIHDEIDMEFLGNSTGEPYTLHTNIYVNGTGRKVEQFRLWFDPTADFHTYSIVWTYRHILMLVDGTPIREFRNHANRDVLYPSKQPMRLFGSLWNTDDWATQGGRVKTDWSAAPFIAWFRNYTATTSSSDGYGYYDQEMDGAARKKMKEARAKYMIYTYCADTTRSPTPPECSMP